MLGSMSAAAKSAVVPRQSFCALSDTLLPLVQEMHGV